MISYTRILCSVVLVLSALEVKALSQRFTSESFQYALQNIRTFNDKIYIGGTNMLFILNKDLSIHQSASTCSMSCGNINQVLLVLEERQELLVCGTGKNGICEVRSTDDIGNVLRTSSQTTMKVSTDPSRPAQAVVLEDATVMFAVTFGDGIDIKKSLFQYLTYDYAISTRNVINFKPVSTNIGIKSLRVDIVEEYIQEYIIYFKGVFQFNWFTYFVTNQKKTVKSTDYISKLTSLCQNDTDFKSYADIFLTCVFDGISYNLIQESTLIEPPESFGLSSNDTMLVAAFTRGNDPTNVSGNTAICVSKISDIQMDILEAKRKYALACEKQDTSERYLPDLRSANCISEENLKFRDYDFTCESAYFTFLYVIGNLTHTMTATYLLEGVNGQVTALDGVAVNGENVVLFAGTSTGFLVQLTMTSLYSPMEKFSTTVLGTPIQRIHLQDDDSIYVLGSRKVYLFARSNCSEFKTCEETMDSRNPFCGWCIYKQRATRKSNCSEAPYHWISSLYQCKSEMTLTPSNIPVTDSKIKNANVTLTYAHFPRPEDGDIFKCRLVDVNSHITADDIEAKRKGEEFSCIMPLITEHSELKLELYVHTSFNGNIVLSEAPILFFECEKLTGCRDCIVRSDKHCTWCNDVVGCQSRDTNCKSQHIKSEQLCPQMLDLRGHFYAHAGQITSVSFQGKYLPSSDTGTKYIYKCKMSSTTSNAYVVNDLIICSVNAPQLSDKPLLNETTKIYFGTVDKRSTLQDDFDHYVTIYNCTILASDCSHCEALNKTRFSCGWCTNTSRCEYNGDDNCHMTECPAPTITKVIPRDGPVTGSTRVTIYGINLGSNVSEIESIKMAEIPCTIIDEISEMNVTDYGNFESKAPNLIICETESPHNETSGTVSITVNGQVSHSDDLFFFRLPVVTDINPSYGPEVGGTRVTISGQNLAIGNRNVLVQLEGKVCLNPEVRPKLPVEIISPANATIVCTVGKGYASNITMVTLSMDDKIVISEAPATFTFVSNPVLISISPKKAFLSGGTTFTFEGKEIDNSHEAKITLNYKRHTQIGDCIILSESSGICRVPRAPENLKLEFFKSGVKSGLTESIRVLCVLHLDNVKENVEITYYQDPTINDLAGDNNVVKYDANDRLLKVTGKRLDDVATKSDINITIGVESCVLVTLMSSYITCIVPKHKPRTGIPNNEHPEVNVTIGNIQKMVGYLDYDNLLSEWINNPIVILSAAVACAVLILIISMATILICRQYRRMKSKLQILVSQGSIKEDNTDVIRFSRLAGKSSDIEYSDLYNDINEPFGPGVYNTITTDDLERSRRAAADDSESSYLNEHLSNTCQRSQDPLPAMNKITVEIQLEGTTAKNVALVPEIKAKNVALVPGTSAKNAVVVPVRTDDLSYLHAVNES